VIAVFDIDGVLADATHREHFVERRPKDWDAFFAGVGDDALLERGRERLNSLAREHEVVLLSGRPERTRADTEAWLARHDIEVSRLILRRDDDFRPAADLKAALVAGIGGPHEVVVVVDDDDTVVKRLQGLGYVAELFR
jgi:hypothetical protein